MPDVNSYDNLIDSRDVIERIKDLEAELEAWVEGSGVELAEWLEDGNSAADFVAGQLADEFPEAAELDMLKALAAEASDYADDWYRGATLIRHSYFTEYAQELAEETIEDFDAKSNQWPFNCIDWDEAADVLLEAYTSVEFDGATYYVQ